MTDAANILLISSAENDDNTATNNKFVVNLNRRLKGQARLEWHNYHNLGLELQQGSLRAFLVSNERNLKTFTAVYFKSIFRYHEQATAIAEVLTAQGVKFVGNELRSYIPAHKLSQMARLARAGVAIAHTLYLPLEHYDAYYATLKEQLSEPFIFKAIDGSTGDDNYLVTSQQQLSKIVSANHGRHFIAQTFIPNDSDLRLLVIGNQVRLIIERRRQDDATHLNNTSQGGSARLLPVNKADPALIKLALQAAALMGRDVAGVDIMLERGSNQPYVLEVNASPQIASGAFEAEKLAVYTDYFVDLATKMPKPPQLIGRAEPISLPAQGLSNVPARIDTGARTSAIWASSIVENDGELAFILFDKQSDLYNGEVVRTRQYERRLVANSAGMVEERYAVKLLVDLHGRKVRATFTLANRASQVYPVLLGRNILRGKFMVDVTLGAPLRSREKQREVTKQQAIKAQKSQQ